MKQKKILYIITGSLAVSAALITALASANITTDCKNKSMMHAQNLNTDDDGAISFFEFAAPQNRCIAKLDCDKNGLIENNKFNNRLMTTFNKVDRDGDELLRNNELRAALLRQET